MIIHTISWTRIDQSETMPFSYVIKYETCLHQSGDKLNNIARPQVKISMFASEWTSRVDKMCFCTGANVGSALRSFRSPCAGKMVSSRTWDRHNPYKGVPQVTHVLWRHYCAENGATDRVTELSRNEALFGTFLKFSR